MTLAALYPDHWSGSLVRLCSDRISRAVCPIDPVFEFMFVEDDGQHPEKMMSNPSLGPIEFVVSELPSVTGDHHTMVWIKRTADLETWNLNCWK